MRHPEQQEDEIFIGNYTDMYRNEYASIGWTSKRKGKKAYSTKGEVVECAYPIFISKAEVKANLQLQSISDEERKLYEQMLEKETVF